MASKDSDKKVRTEDDIFLLARIFGIVGAFVGIAFAFVDAYTPSPYSSDIVWLVASCGLIGLVCGFGIGFLIEVFFGPFFPGQTKSQPDVGHANNTTSTSKATVHIHVSHDHKG